MTERLTAEELAADKMDLERGTRIGDDRLRRLLAAAEENERLRSGLVTCQESLAFHERECERLREALHFYTNRTGNWTMRQNQDANTGDL